jgi:hypothetical protein
LSLSLEYDDQLLVGGNGAATIYLTTGSIEITGMVRRERISFLTGGIEEVEHFFVRIDQLPATLQAEVRSNIIEAQLEIDEKDPRRIAKRRAFADTSPKPVEVRDDYQLVLIQHRTYRGHPCLRLGKELVAHARKPLDGPKYSLGTITRMDVHS